MTAVPLFDALALAAPAPGGEETGMNRDLVTLGEKLVAGALADALRLFEYEAQALARGWKDEVLHDRLTKLVYELFEQWAAEATQVLDRVRPLTAAGATFQDLSALEDAWWRIQARLKLTPDQIKRATDQVRRGEFIPLEAVRDELRDRLRP